MPPRSTDGPSRTPRGRNGASPAPRGGEQGDMVLDLTNMVAADGSVVTIAPTFPQNGRGAPPPAAQPAFEQPTVPHGGFARRAPPPGPGAEPRAHSFTPQASAPAQAQAYSTDTPSHGARAPEPMQLPPTLSEDSPSRRVFKRRHTAGSAFAELAQSGFTPPPQDPNGNFGKVPVGSVATELDMGVQTAAMPVAPAAPPMAQPMAPAAPPMAQSYPADPYVAPAPHQAMPAAMPAPAAPAMSEEQMRAAVAGAAEPIVRSWLDANLAGMIEQQLTGLVQQRVDETVAGTLPQAVDQRIHQNVEKNLGPYIEDRVGAHVDARLAAAVEEKVTAAVKQQVAAAVNQQLGQAVSQQVAAAVAQQLQGQQQNVARLVDERVKNEIRSLFQRLAGN